MTVSSGAEPMSSSVAVKAAGSGFDAPSSSEMPMASSCSSSPSSSTLRRCIHDGPLVSSPVRTPASRSSRSSSMACSTKRERPSCSSRRRTAVSCSASDGSPHGSHTAIRCRRR